MSFLPYSYNPSFSPYPPYSHPFSQSLTTPSPIYTLLIVGMVLFMAANVMPNLIPAADRVWHVAPMVLQWGFIIIIFALMVQMLGIVPGVPQLHITYVHMALASLLFILMWNHIVSEIPPPAEEKKSSSSTSRESPSEKKHEKNKKDEGPSEPSPWDDLRSHPSAFLTTRLNKLMPWPFPLGRARREGNELWWEKGMPSHVGHFNKPDPEIEKRAKEEEARKKKDKERARLKEEEKAKEAERQKEKDKAKKEAEVKAKMKEEEMKKAKEDAKRRKEELERKKVEDRHKQKLWRTKYLAMIIGVSMLNKTLGFLLLLLFSLQMVSQELNDTPQSSSTNSSSSGNSSSAGSSSSREEKEKLARLQAQREKEKAAAAAAAKSSSRDPTKSSSSSSSSRDTSKSSSSSSKSSSKDPVSSDAIRKTSGNTTVTNVDPDGCGIGVPYKVGFGMNYIHTPNPDKKDHLTLPSMTIPSAGMSHPLMTTTYRQYAN
ncbi:hypothetical protein I203_102072 [Kwoniella mangroviensis CBS 8507]|uniref:uncharacterized protein n=1 Tax=Kwoniella mangroviensis CBS 8507 TaxID=1296122 RepID=UPI00080D5F7B|nr:uncharacterized protein I203_03267 [Kwoniella mangroviensis CBS 8507]OCF67570.1 hypothetical protein I203_03267 [Kwoniella mangroviensis CBS 8507]